MPNFVFDISKQTDLTLSDSLGLKNWMISCMIENNWFTHEFDVQKPD